MKEFFKETVVRVVIGGALSSIIASIAIEYIHEKSLSMAYNISFSQKFALNSEYGQVIITTLSNNSNNIIEKIRLRVDSADAKIIGYQIKMGNIIEFCRISSRHSDIHTRINVYPISKNDTTESCIITSDMLDAYIPFINPKEVLEVTLTTIGSMSGPPLVEARAYGVSAERADFIEQTAFLEARAIVLIVGSAFNLTIIFVILVVLQVQPRSRALP